MTTWLRALVEERARRTNPSFFLSLSPTVFYFIHFLTNRKHDTGILATGCRLTTSSSIHGIQLLPIIVSYPVVTHLVLSTKTRVAYHPVSILLQVCIIEILIQYQKVSYSILFIVQYIYCLLLTTICLYSCLQIIEPHLLGLSYYHLLGSQSNIMQYHNIINTIPHSTSIMYVILLQTITK